MNPLTQLCLYVSLICCLAGSCAAAYIPEEKLENLLSYAVSGNQLYINIPVQLAPWRSVDVIQYNNRLNLHWNTGAGSSFMECKDKTCKPAAVGQDLGDETDAAASYDVSPPAGVSSLKYISPQLVSSTDGDYDVSFVVVIQYDDDSRNQYAQINARFE